MQQRSDAPKLWKGWQTGKDRRSGLLQRFLEQVYFWDHKIFVWDQKNQHKHFVIRLRFWYTYTAYINLSSRMGGSKGSQTHDGLKCQAACRRTRTSGSFRCGLWLKDRCHLFLDLDGTVVLISFPPPSSSPHPIPRSFFTSTVRFLRGAILAY